MLRDPFGHDDKTKDSLTITIVSEPITKEFTFNKLYIQDLEYIVDFIGFGYLSEDMNFNITLYADCDEAHYKKVVHHIARFIDLVYFEGKDNKYYEAHVNDVSVETMYNKVCSNNFTYR
jgi:hypothetical protein